MEEVYAMRKMIPGQIWLMEINTESINGNWCKKRPYLVVASNNRRVTVLEMTSGGQYSSNWIFKFSKMNGDDSNIITDCPITVNLDKIPSMEYMATLSEDLFMKIFKQHIAAMLHQSIPNLLKNEKFINDINEIIDNHEDKLLSYSIYKMQYEFTPVDEPEETNDEQKVDTVPTPTPTPKPERKPEPIPEPKPERKNIPKPTTQYPSKNIRVEDIAIFGAGKTSESVVYNACTKFGIKNAKFELHQHVANKKLSHVHDKYGLILKSELAPSEHRREVLADCEKFGIKKTAEIWGRSYNAIWYIQNDKKR